MISLGLYISKESFFIAEVSVSRQKPKILHLEETFWVNLESEEEKMALLSQKIQEREQVYKGQNIRICCSLPQNFVSTFSLQLPFKERFKILKTIPFEVEDHTPFQTNKVLFDVKVCQIEAQNKAHILSFVTPEESVQDFLQILQGLNKPIHLLSCSAASLANLLETWNTPLSKPQNPDPSIDTYLYLGIENSYLFFYKKGFLHHFAVLDWGCGGIVEEMQSTYKLSREKAWQEFFNKAFLLTQVKGFTKEQVFFSNLVKKHTEQFIPKFNLLKMSLAAKKDLQVSHIMLFGPGAMIKNLSSFLSDQLDLSAYKSRYLTAFSNWDWREKPSALIAVGLTLEGLKRYPYPGLDFLSFQKEAPSLISLGSMKNRAFIALLTLVFFFAYAFVKKYETDQVLEKVQGVFKEYARKIAYLSPNKIEVQEVETFLKEQDKKQSAEEDIQKELSKPNPIEALQKIVMKVGSAGDWDLNLEYLKISGLNVEMRGSLQASKLKSFQSLIQSLTSTKLGNIKGEAGDSKNENIGGVGPERQGDNKKSQDTDTKAIGSVAGENSDSGDMDIRDTNGRELPFDELENQEEIDDEIEESQNEGELSRADFSFSFKLKPEL